MDDDDTTAVETRRADLPIAGRLAEVRGFQRAQPAESSSLDTAHLVLSVGAAVRRYDWMRERYYDEQLVVEPGAVRMERLQRGAPLLNSHSSYDLEDILGRLSNPTITAGRLEADATFSRRESVAGYVQDVADGIITNVSIGYARKRIEMEPPADDGGVWVYRVTDWEVLEASLVPIPADMDAQVQRSAAPGADPAARAAAERIERRTYPCEFVDMTTRATRSPTAPAAPAVTTMTEAELQAQREQEAAAARAAADAQRQRDADAAAAQAAAAATAAAERAASITELCQRHGLPQLAPQLIREGRSAADAGLAVLDELARRDQGTGGQRNVNVRTVTDETVTRMQGMSTAIECRMDSRVQLDDNARQFRGMSLLEIGREMLELRSVNTRGMTKMELAGVLLTHRSTPGMQTTSDFATLFGGVARRRLRTAYEQEQPSYTLWARRAPDAPDFRDMQVIALSGAPELLKVNEHGEFKYGALSDGSESYRLLTYGRIVAITRQAIVNDDLRTFDRLVAAFGDSAARLENRLVYAQLTDNPTLATDSVALFHATHGNLGTGAGSALSLTSLQAARSAMRTRTGLSGEYLNVTPRYLIVPAALESTAYQLTSSQYMPTAQSGINEFAAGGRTSLTVIVEPLLDAVSTTAWYLASGSGGIDTVEYSFLEGEVGPQIEVKDGFDVDGTSWKCREDFAAKVTDFRGLYKSNGA